MIYKFTNKNLSRIFIFFICLAAPMTRIKILDIQLAEMLIAVAIIFGILKTGKSNFKISLLKEFKWQYILLILICAFAVYFAFLAMFRPFYLPNNSLSIFKQPGWLSVSRLLQLVYMFAGSFICLKCISYSKENIHYFFKTYTVMGTLWSIYSILSYILIMYTGIDIGGTMQQGIWLRARGMFIEGGTFGLYLVSAIASGLIFSVVLQKKIKSFFIFNILVQSTAFLLSYSKAGTMALIAICCVLAFLGIRKNRKLLIFVLLLFIVASLRINFLLDGVRGYFSSRDTIYSRIENQSNDANLFLGRVMGMILVPRMIIDHPIIGIGIGNYSLVRNSPNYLKGLPETTSWDLAGLGIYGYIAETGIPLICLLLIVFFIPFKILFKMKYHPLLISISLYQLFAHLFGVQITFFYPWLFSAGFLAIAYEWNLNQRKKGMIY